MSRSIFTGATDYSNQSLPDMIEDIKKWIEDLKITLDFFHTTINKLERNGYWMKADVDYKMLFSNAMQLFETSLQELIDISKELNREVCKDHISRIKSLGKCAKKLSQQLGITWHEKYLEQDFQNETCEFMENLYTNGRDMLNDMVDLINLAFRLKDFIGKKSKVYSALDMAELKPNICGIGLNLNEILKRIFKKN